MSIDFELTAGKEIRNQAELYRILSNVSMREFPRLSGYGWDLDGVLIEATILDSESESVGEADLILMARNPTDKRVPLIVIEVKKTVVRNLTRPFQSSFKQAWKYANPIGCEFYAVYDGHFIITMQRSSPYLVGMCEFPINSNQTQKREFAKGIWGSLLGLQGKGASGPIKHLCGVLNYPRWKRTIRFLIRDAYKRFHNTNPSESAVEDIAETWDERNR